MDQTPTSHSHKHDYTSNPFLNATKGLVLTLSHNPGPALLSGFLSLIFILVLYLATILAGLVSPILALVFILIIICGYVLVLGTFYFIGAASAEGHHLTTKRAIEGSLQRFWPLLGLTLMLIVVSLVGLVLLVVPGVYFIGRSSLSPIVMFAEDMGPMAALKRSFKLTKGHVNEMLGAMFAGVFIGESYYSLLFGAVSVSPIVGRYYDLKMLEASGGKKPKTHWLNYLYLIGFLLLAVLIAFIVTGTLKSTKVTTTSTPFTQSGSGTFNSGSSTLNSGSSTLAQ